MCVCNPIPGRPKTGLTRIPYTKDKKCTVIECNQINFTECTLEEMFSVGLFIKVAGWCPLTDV